MAEIVKNEPGDPCATPDCTDVAVEVLAELPHNGRRYVFAFCRDHADEMALSGYERIGQTRPGQLGMSL